MEIGAGWESPLLAAHTISVQIFIIALLPAMALGCATTTFVAKSIEQGPKEIERSVETAARYSIMGAVLILLICALVSPYLPRFISSDLEVQKHLMFGLIWLGTASFFEVISSTYSGALRGVGRTLYPSAIHVGTCWFVLIPFGWIASSFIEYHGAWIVLGIQTFSLFVLNRYRWLHIHKIEKDRSFSIIKTKESVGVGIC